MTKKVASSSWLAPVDYVETLQNTVAAKTLLHRIEPAPALAILLIIKPIKHQQIQ
jgi:hypothetical protein